MIYDLIIAGAGPAGIAAGIYAARKKMSILLLEKYFEIGGKLINNTKIDNYPGFPNISGFELSQNFKNHLIKNNAVIREERVINIKKNNNAFEIFTGENIYKAISIIIAAGMEEKRTGAIDEEKFIGRGISYCSTCDAPLYRGKIVGVYGSGLEAEKTMVDLLPYAKKIYFIPDKKYKSFYLEEVKKNIDLGNIIAKGNSNLRSFKGKDNLEEVTISIRKRSEDLKVEGFFINLGYIPSTEFIKDFLKINNKKEIIIDQKNRTSVKGIFAAGDCTNYPYKQVLVAAAQGAAAALSAYKYLHETK